MKTVWMWLLVACFLLPVATCIRIDWLRERLTMAKDDEKEGRVRRMDVLLVLLIAEVAIDVTLAGIYLNLP